MLRPCTPRCTAVATQLDSCIRNTLRLGCCVSCLQASEMTIAVGMVSASCCRLALFRAASSALAALYACRGMPFHLVYAAVSSTALIHISRCRHHLQGHHPAHQHLPCARPPAPARRLVSERALLQIHRAWKRMAELCRPTWCTACDRHACLGCTRWPGSCGVCLCSPPASPAAQHHLPGPLPPLPHGPLSFVSTTHTMVAEVEHYQQHHWRW